MEKNMDTNFDTLPVGVPGREIILICTQGTGNITAGGNIRLNQNLDVAVNPGTSLHLVYMDAPVDAWVEISRSEIP